MVLRNGAAITCGSYFICLDPHSPIQPSSTDLSYRTTELCRNYDKPLAFLSRLHRPSFCRDSGLASGDPHHKLVFRLRCCFQAVLLFSGCVVVFRLCCCFQAVLLFSGCLSTQLLRRSVPLVSNATLQKQHLTLTPVKQGRQYGPTGKYSHHTVERIWTHR